MQSINRLIEKSKNVRKGFTVLELLVASMLLGMLMTILTMIFSQSSIAWKTGVAGVSNMDAARKDISDIRCQSDNFYEWNGEHYIQSVFNEDGTVRTQREGSDGYVATTFDKSGSASITVPSSTETDADKSYDTVAPRTPSKGDNGKSYIVNVMSYGPDRKKDTRYDNVYSVSPSDDPSQW